MSSARSLLCLVALLVSSVGAAQAPEEVPPSSSEPSIPPPPLVPAPEPSEPAPPQGELIPYHYRPEHPEEASSTRRILLEVIAGGGTGVAAGIAGLFTGALLVGFDCTGSDCAIPAVGAMTLGIIFGTPLGVYGVGRAMDGRGAYWASLVGTTLGSLVGITLAIGALSAGSDLLTLISLIAGPVAGAVIGYELSHASRRPPPQPAKSTASASAGVQCVPVVAISPAGGFVGGLAGRF